MMSVKLIFEIFLINVAIGFEFVLNYLNFTIYIHINCRYLYSNILSYIIMYELC